MKGKALLSLGAFLKNSESMLVLWDPRPHPGMRSLAYIDVVSLDVLAYFRSFAGGALLFLLEMGQGEHMRTQDTSWSHRLWCVFELAAYLRSCEQEGKKPNIVIRPTGIGPSNFLQTLALLIVFLAAGLVPDRQKEFLWTMQALFA